MFHDEKHLTVNPLGRKDHGSPTVIHTLVRIPIDGCSRIHGACLSTPSTRSNGRVACPIAYPRHLNKRTPLRSSSLQRLPRKDNRHLQDLRSSDRILRKLHHGQTRLSPHVILETRGRAHHRRTNHRWHPLRSDQRPCFQKMHPSSVLLLRPFRLVRFRFVFRVRHQCRHRAIFH